MDSKLLKKTYYLCKKKIFQQIPQQKGAILYKFNTKAKILYLLRSLECVWNDLLQKYFDTILSTILSAFSKM